VVPVDRESTVIDPDARGVTVTTTASLLLLRDLAGLLLVEQRPDRVSIALVIAAVVGLLGARAAERAVPRPAAAPAARRGDGGPADRARQPPRARHADGQLPRGEPWCLLTVDLDGFKDVNDLLGHATGDRLLAAVASRLAEAVPAEALVSRIGGDEFAVLLPGELPYGATVGESIVTAVRRSAADVEGVAARRGVGERRRRGRERRRRRAAHAGAAGRRRGGSARRRSPPGAGRRRRRRLPARLATSRRPDRRRRGGPRGDADRRRGGRGRRRGADRGPAGRAVGVRRRAARREGAGRNRVEIYDAGIARLRRRRLRVEERLRAASRPATSPCSTSRSCDLRRGVVTGAEALARWTDPQLGVVDPASSSRWPSRPGWSSALGERVLDETLGAAVREGLFERAGCGCRATCRRCSCASRGSTAWCRRRWRRTASSATGS
jgi:GGDEF domain-containing protein